MPTKLEVKSVSVIIPVGGRFGDARKLYRDYQAGLAALAVPAEVLFVLDGPRPTFASQLEELLSRGEQFTVISLARPFGGAAALMAGVERASGDVIVTLPAYDQIEPADIPKLVAAVETADIAIAMRSPRVARFFDRLRRATFHKLVHWLIGPQFHDLGCGARAIRRKVFDEIEVYGDQHRFLPVLADRLGFRVVEIPVRQSANDRFPHVYRPREYMRYVLDLFSTFFLVRFTKRPLRFFGMVGATTFGVGVLAVGYLCIERLVFNEPLADRPALLLATLLVVLGMQIFALGLLGELIIFTHARDLKDYRVEEVIEFATPKPESVSEPQAPVVPTPRESALPAASPHAVA